MFKYLLFFKILIFMITIHTVKQKNTGEDKNKHGKKKHISLTGPQSKYNDEIQ